MNWDAILAIGSALGAIAVQIRQDTAAVATATYESVMSYILLCFSIQ